MQIKISGELTIAALRQVLFEKLGEMESEYAVRYTMGATLFVNPTNGFGTRVAPQDQHGKEVKSMYGKGPYHSAAEEFDL